MNGDPLNPWEAQDRLGPAGDLNPDTPDLTGTINTIGIGVAFVDEGDAEREAADAEQTAAGGVGDTGPEPVPDADADDLEADNEVEEDTIETVDPANPPA